MIEELKCIEPDQVNEADYLAVIENDDRPEFTRHLKNCLYCQAELTTYRDWDSRLHRDFAFITSPARALCAETQRLGELILGLLSPVESKKLEDHIKICSFCATEIADLKAWIPEFQPVAKPNPKGPVEQLRRLIAHLVSFSDMTGTPNYVMAGVRGDDEGLPQTYQAEEVSITVTIQPIQPYSKQRMVLGLVQRDNYPMDATAGAEVRIREGPNVLATETIDELGNFVFAEVTPPEHFFWRSLLTIKSC